MLIIENLENKMYKKKYYHLEIIINTLLSIYFHIHVH